MIYYPEPRFFRPSADHRLSIDDELERQLQDELTAPSREIIGNMDTGSIVSGRRKRDTIG